MKILVLSDSHSSLRFMWTCAEKIQPDAIIHLGDHVCDGEALAEDFPQIPMFQVAGNCDRYRVAPDYPEIKLETLGGVRIFMTHGHLQGVKLYKEKLIADARKCQAKVALYGHTHEADCRLLEDGMWVMNPGSCGAYGGTAGIIDIGPDREVTCRIVYQRDMEGLK